MKDDVESNPSCVNQIFTFWIGTTSILDHYLTNMGLFQDVDVEKVSQIFKRLDGYVTEIKVALENHSAGFQKLTTRSRFYDPKSLKTTVTEHADYIFSEKLMDGWQYLWGFNLNDFLAYEDYVRIVGKRYQNISGEEIEDQDKKGFGIHGEQLRLRFDATELEILLYGEFGRFKTDALTRHPLDHDILEENVIMRAHPGAKEFESKHDSEYYRPSARYREWEYHHGDKNISFQWGMSLFDIGGIQDQENRIKPDPRLSINRKL